MNRKTIIWFTASTVALVLAGIGTISELSGDIYTGPPPTQSEQSEQQPVSTDFISTYASPVDQEVCHWQMEYKNIKNLLPTGETQWYVQDIVDHQASGITYNESPIQVVIDPDTPCRSIRSVVIHEWAHTVQYKKYTYPVGQVYDSVRIAEIVADCTAYHMGARNLNYANPLSDCTGAIDRMAWDLIKFSPING